MFSGYGVFQAELLKRQAEYAVARRGLKNEMEEVAFNGTARQIFEKMRAMEKEGQLSEAVLAGALTVGLRWNNSLFVMPLLLHKLLKTDCSNDQLRHYSFYKEDLLDYICMYKYEKRAILLMNALSRDTKLGEFFRAPRGMFACKRGYGTLAKIEHHLKELHEWAVLNNKQTIVKRCEALGLKSVKLVTVKLPSPSPTHR